MLPLFNEHSEREYRYDQTPLLPPTAAKARGPARTTTAAAAAGTAATSAGATGGGGGGGGGHGTTPPALGYVSLSLCTDWGMANTSAGDHGNSAFEFTRRRRAAAAAAAAQAGGAAAADDEIVFGSPAAKPRASVASSPQLLSPTKRLARDVVVLRSLGSPVAGSPGGMGGGGMGGGGMGGGGVGGAESPGASPGAGGGGGGGLRIKLDTERYARYERAKAALQPRQGVGDETVIRL